MDQTQFLKYHTNIIILTWTKKTTTTTYNGIECLIMPKNLLQVAVNTENVGIACSQVESYSGEICRNELTSLQLCFFGATTSSQVLNIPTSIPQESSESDAMLLVDGLSNILTPSEECLAAIVPFLCLSLFPLCDPDNNLRTISREDCLSLRDEICVDTWRLAARVLGPGVLPICEELPDVSNGCINSKLLNLQFEVIIALTC